MTSDSGRGTSPVETSAPQRATADVLPATAAGMLAHGLRGLLMGAADVVPGVSGGTVALILGIYERLVGAVHEVAAGIVAALRGGRSQALAHWRNADLLFVLPLGLGIVVAIGIGSLVLPPLIETYPVIMSAIFFGLIAGALRIPWRRMSAPRGFHYYALAVAGAVVAFVFSGFAPQDITDPSLLFVFGAAAIAICAMILPGVSGAYLLLVIGIYDVTLEAVSGLDVAYIAVFVAGAATGLGVFSKLLSWLLAERHDPTMAVLVGLMAGSLRRLWPWQTEAGALHAPPDGGALLLAVLCAVIGIVVVAGLAIIGERSTRPQAAGGSERPPGRGSA